MTASQAIRASMGQMSPIELLELAIFLNPIMVPIVNRRNLMRGIVGVKPIKEGEK